MKRFYNYLLAVSALFIFIVFPKNVMCYPTGSPPGYTGSPGDVNNCTHCHGGTAGTLSGVMSSNVPAAGYTPGSTYNITVTLTGSGSKGFEVSPQTLTGALIGTLIAGTGSQLVGSGEYVTHLLDSLANPTKWSFQWTAPKPGVGSVTFYGAFVIGYSNVYTSTMVIPENTVSVAEYNEIDNVVQVFPNPFNDKLNLSYKVNEPSDVKILLYSLDGKNVISLLNERQAISTHNETFSLPSNLSNGIYFLKLQIGSDVKVVKLIKQ